jgi:hypothetical protein
MLPDYAESQRERPDMMKSDVMCHVCGAGFRRIELMSRPGFQGQYRCPACDTILEAFDGDHLVAYRLTVQPLAKTLDQPGT